MTPAYAINAPLIQNVGLEQMKRTAIIDGIIILMAGPLMVVVVRILDSGSLSVSKLLLEGYFPHGGILTHSILQDLVLLGPICFFLMLTIVTLLKGKYRTSIGMSFMTSLSWAHMMFWAVFSRFGP